MIDAALCGALTLEKLEAMTCVCSVGLDMICIPGDTTAATISAIIADEVAIGMVNQKTTAVRLTGDRGLAKVYYTVLGDEDQAKRTGKALGRANGFLRTQLAQRLRLKKAPELRFFLDTTIEEGNKMEALLAKIKEEEAQRPVVEDKPESGS